MTSEREFDRNLRAWFDDRSTQAAPNDLLARSLIRVASVRQRPKLLTREAIARPWPGAAHAPVLVPAVIGLVVLLAALIVVAGSQLVRPTPALVAPVPNPSPSRTATQTPTPTSTPEARPSVTGGGPILAHSFTKIGDPGPFEVVAIDAGTGSTTRLGTLPGSSVTHSCCPYIFEHSADRSHVLIIGGVLENATPAATRFGFTSANEADQGLDFVALSPAGDRLAWIAVDNSERPRKIMIGDLQAKILDRLAIPASSRYIQELMWKPDGSAVLVTGCDPCNKAETPTGKQTSHHSHLYVVPLDGSPPRTLLDADNGGLDAQWSPDGKTLAVEQFDCPAGTFAPRCEPTEGSLSVIDLESGLGTSLGRKQGLTDVSWSPDGTSLAFTDRDGLEIVDVVARRTSLAVPQGFGLGWSPDGDWLMLRMGTEIETFDIWVVRADGTELHKVASGYGGEIW